MFNPMRGQAVVAVCLAAAAVRPSAGQCAAAWDPSFGAAGANARVRAMVVFDDGGGPALYACGDFTSIGSTSANFIARWNGSSWSSLGSGLSGGSANALAVFDDGSGPALYVAGNFSTAGGSPANRVARWNGSSWSAVGTGLNAPVRALAVFDEDGPVGNPPRLFAGGDFSSSTGNPNRVARWDGTSWTALGTGADGSVNALATFDDGTGASLYAGGAFSTAGGSSANNIARWNGTGWSPLGSAGSNGANNTVLALTVFDDDGSGPGTAALYVGGNFSSVSDAGGSTTASRIARWGGSTWSALGAGIGGTNVASLAGFDDDGAGPNPAVLIAGGLYTSAGGTPASNIAAWNGSAWSALGSGTDAVVNALAQFDAGGPALYAGGNFGLAGGSTAQFIARWRTVGAPPVITQDPAGGCFCTGAQVTLTVTATGGGLSYQWYKNTTLPLTDGGNISGATSDALTIDPVGAGDAGTYHVVVTNACGSVPSATANVDVDTAPPTLAGVPGDTTVECDAVPAPAAVTATDDCDTAPSISLSETTTPGGCPHNYTLTRTWTATDDCGNSAGAAQVIAVVDTTPPALSVDTTPICVTDGDCDGAEAVLLPTASATDNCDGAPSVSHDAPALFPAGQTTIVTFTATDACGNQSTATVDVTVLYGSNVEVHAVKHTISLGSHPAVSKTPLAGIDVLAFDTSCGSCACQQTGHGCGITWRDYPDIVANCTPAGLAVTDSAGLATINLPPGEYILISPIDTDGDDVVDCYLSKRVGDLECGETQRRRLRLVETARGKKLPCKLQRLTGSELLIIEPEYMIWDESEQLYPFVFESVGEWGVVAEVTPPDGFVSDYPELSTEVNNDDASVQFTITELGSDLVPTATRFRVQHNGRAIDVRGRVDITLTEDYALLRGFDLRELRARGLIWERATNLRPVPRSTHDAAFSAPRKEQE